MLKRTLQLGHLWLSGTHSSRHHLAIILEAPETFHPVPRPYNITAKSENASGETPSDPRQLSEEQRKTYQEQMRLRLQELLVDRFQLKIHRETKELPVYALAVAKNGPKLKANTNTNAGPGKGLMRISPGQIAGQGVGTEFLAGDLARRLGRTVLDQTGLKGAYDFELNFASEPRPDRRVRRACSGRRRCSASSTSRHGAGSDQRTAAGRSQPHHLHCPSGAARAEARIAEGPVDIIVIDHVEKPSEN